MYEDSTVRESLDRGKQTTQDPISDLATLTAFAKERPFSENSD